ncbi:MAG: xanthine dehydrogenase family protein molybdopterin-binding subunit [Nitrososphaerales archaeon]
MEDPRLLTGRGRYVDDLRMEGQAYMGIVRSPFAHATIRGIDFSKARASPDFIAALTGEDLVQQGVTTVPQNQWPPQKPAKRYHLAVGKVRFTGEPVAAILVRRKNSLEDLVEQVEVDYDPLPVVTTIEESKKGKTLIYEDWGDNLSQGNDVKWGSAEKVIASAPYVIRAKEGIARQGSVPMEPHSTLVQYKKYEDVYEVYATVQSVHGLRGQLASQLHIPEERFHVKVMDMGGGFGSKGAQSYPEPLLACLFSRTTGLPVKWTATRTEEFLEAASGRDEYCDITLACDKDGKIVAVKAEVECDVGVTGTQNHMSQLSLWSMLGPYRIPNVDLRLAVYATNKMPLGPVRGAGAPEGCYFIERAMNIMAQKMGIDPLELRKRNLSAERRPGDTDREPSGKEDRVGLINDLISRSRYEELLRWKGDVNSRFKQRGPSHSNVVAGLGVSFGGRSSIGGDEDEEENSESEESRGSGGSPEGSSHEETEQQQDGRQGDQGEKGWESKGQEENDEASSWGESENTGSGVELDFESEYARVTLDRNGKVTVYTGSSPHGQGIETTFAQLASEELRVPLDKVSVVWGDSVLVPAGIGTFGSRSAVTGGSAVVDASRKLRARLFARVSELTGDRAEALSISDGRLVNTSRPSAELPTIAEVLERLGLAEMSAESSYKVSSMSYSTGVHLCALTLDVELGTVKILRYVVVEDCGTMINKKIVEGQLHGGVVHAVGGALFERLAYDEQGNLLTGTLVDYGIPTALDSPDVEVFHEVTPSTGALNGAKGVGESGTIVGYAAVMNALNDALSFVRPGARVDVAPSTPDSILAAINQPH